MGVEAEAGVGELGHVGAADEDGAGGSEALDDCCILLGGRGVGEDQGAGGGGVAGDVEEVLDGDGEAEQGEAGVVLAEEGVGCVRGLLGGGGIDATEGAGAFAGGIGDGGEALFDEVAAGDLVVAELVEDGGDG